MILLQGLSDVFGPIGDRASHKSRMDIVELFVICPFLLNIVDFKLHIRWNPRFVRISHRCEWNDLHGRLGWTEIYSDYLRRSELVFKVLIVDIPLLMEIHHLAFLSTGFVQRKVEGIVRTSFDRPYACPRTQVFV